MKYDRESEARQTKILEEAEKRAEAQLQMKEKNRKKKKVGLYHQNYTRAQSLTQFLYSTDISKTARFYPKFEHSLKSVC